MKIVFLVGNDTFSTRTSIEAVCKNHKIKCVAVLMDSENVPFTKRLSNLKRNIRREGVTYIYYRVISAINIYLKKKASQIIAAKEIYELLKKAFPERSFSIMDLSRKYGFPIIRVGSLNSDMASDELRKYNADLGVVLGTRILKKKTFAIPRLGCINLHKGKVPEFRGQPAGFWELYEGEKVAGVTVHYVDEGLDTGDIVGTIEVPIHKNETVSSLQNKLHWEGANLLAKCLGEIESGISNRKQQIQKNLSFRTNPTRKQCIELNKLRPQCNIEEDHLKEIFKTLLYLGIYYLGLYRFVRFVRSKLGHSRCKVILYHRVNDHSTDALTANLETFAGHLLLFKKFYKVKSTSYLIKRITKKDTVFPTTVVIHFDDCYKDVYSRAAPLLIAADMPATAFISSGYIDSDRKFVHDTEKSPFKFNNLSTEEVKELARNGFEIGAHTVNHVNLGKIPIENVKKEVLQGKADLEKIIGKPIDIFSFPFGRKKDISDAAQEFIREAGFSMMFSAYGGTVNTESDIYDMPRIGASSEHIPLYLMMEIEDLAIKNLLDFLMFWKKNR